MSSTSMYQLPGRVQAPASKSEKVVQWVVVHRAQLGLAFGLAVLSGALTTAIVFNRKKLKEGGIAQLSMAAYQASKGQRKEAIQSIDDVLAVQRTNSVGMQAFILKGELLMEDRKFEEAAQSYEEGSRQASLPEYRALMLAGRASAAVEMKKYTDAVGFYEQFLRDFPNHYLVPRSYMELGRIHSALNQWTKAQSAYERLLTLYPKSSWVSEAQANLAFVKTMIPSETAVTGTKN